MILELILIKELNHFLGIFFNLIYKKLLLNDLLSLLQQVYFIEI